MVTVTDHWSSPLPISVPPYTASMHISGLSDISGYACAEITWLDPSNPSISHHRTLSRPRSTPSGYFQTHDTKNIFIIRHDLPRVIELRFSFFRDEDEDEVEDEKKEDKRINGMLVGRVKEKIMGKEIVVESPRVARVGNSVGNGMVDTQVIVKAVVRRGGKESPPSYVNVVFLARRGTQSEELPEIGSNF